MWLKVSIKKYLFNAIINVNLSYAGLQGECIITPYGLRPQLNADRPPGATLSLVNSNKISCLIHGSIEYNIS
jgi:hypothetical protein